MVSRSSSLPFWRGHLDVSGELMPAVEKRLDHANHPAAAALPDRTRFGPVLGLGRGRAGSDTALDLLGASGECREPRHVPRRPRVESGSNAGSGVRAPTTRGPR